MNPACSLCDVQKALSRFFELKACHLHPRLQNWNERQVWPKQPCHTSNHGPREGQESLHLSRWPWSLSRTSFGVLGRELEPERFGLGKCHKLTEQRASS